MSRHIWVNPDRLKKGRRHTRIDGVDLVVEVSPYSSPIGVVGDYSAKSGQFVITFRYIDKEPKSPLVAETEGVIITTGKYSGKLLSIALPIDGPDLKSVSIISLKTRIKDALKSRSRGLEKEGMAENRFDLLNQSIAEEIIDKDLERLAPEPIGNR